jgi:integrase
MANIRQHANGKWQVQIRRKGYPPVAKTFATKAHAVQFARSIESDLDRGAITWSADAERTTIGELIDRYLRDVTPSKRAVRQERQRLAFLKRHFGAYRAIQLQPKHVASYRDDRLAQGKAGGTVIRELNALSHVLEVAVRDWGLPLPLNPAKRIRRPVASRGRDRRVSDEELDALMRVCRKSRATQLAAAVEFAIETGMRLGEMLGLSWPQIDLPHQVATLPLTKNGSAREVPLSTTAVQILQVQPRHISDPRVFWRWKRTDSFEHAWRRAVRKAGLTDLHFHDLRHEATSRFFEMGLDIMEVSAITGHKTLQMLKRYTHLRARDLAQKIG